MAGGAPTICDVASRAGVSVATASNVVSGARPVGEASRRRLVEAIAALGYRLDRSASALRGKSTRLVGMVVPDITNIFFASLVHGVEALAERDGYDLPIVSSGEDAAEERRRVEALVARRIDGLIVVPANDDSMSALAGEADAARLPPAVLIDRGAGWSALTPCAPIATPAATPRRAISSISGIAISPFSPIRSGLTISSCASPAPAGPWPKPGLRARAHRLRRA